ncbi:MAG: hypothetical protein A2X12_06070 [Bacteroidetes bacterium GWE2_29_8]|nr:MAG: hypothetical protein A2X12_06070 [Bacteroidetes bacterium GWE2_29_8]OFY20062.1 MAG: hypothetical protein A2X02_06765 [Bacteroidetes bacterium GWF2_29_10]
MQISIIVAMGIDNVIGYKNQLLCNMPADLKHFKNLTTNHHIIMGRKTFESIGKALPNRTNIILSHSLTNNDYERDDNIVVFDNINKAIKFANKNNENELFIIGGGEIYKSAIDLADKLYITKIENNFEGDTYFPLIDYSKWKLVCESFFSRDEKNNFNYSFSLYNKITNFGRS